MPLVTVICLCYNHERFLEECIMAVLNQTYPVVQLIIMDDSSTDNSWRTIQKLKKKLPSNTLILKTPHNLGNTRAFNQALQNARGKYIIDLSTDDVIHTDRIAQQVSYFESLPSHFGVIYSNAIYIDETGKTLFKKYDDELSLPTGDVYQTLIERYFIPPPTMMIKKDVMDDLNGYDETLSFEDFDFWIRSARHWHYGYQREPLTYIRQTSHSLSSGWYKSGDKQVYSNYLICKKIEQLNKTPEEEESLNKRIRYELRQATLTGNFKESMLFYKLLKERNAVSFQAMFFMIVNYLKLDFSVLFNVYKQWIKKRR